MLKANSDKFSEEEIIEAYNYLNYIKWKNYKGYLYEIIDNSQELIGMANITVLKEIKGTLLKILNLLKWILI